MAVCSWVKVHDPLELAYHDQEWGKPLYDDQALFELLCLEMYQAGLSWSTVLHKRQAFRQAFYQYDVQAVAQMTDSDLDSLLGNADLIRHRGKLYATRTNARAFLVIQERFGSFATYLWAFVEHRPICQSVTAYRDLPSKTPLSERLAKDLKKRGFNFVGPVMAYSFLQAAGLINDHENTCLSKLLPGQM